MPAALQARLDAALLRNSDYNERVNIRPRPSMCWLISASPGDPQPVFDLSGRRRLC
jgi:hypothetical protein